LPLLLGSSVKRRSRQCISSGGYANALGDAASCDGDEEQGERNAVAAAAVPRYFNPPNPGEYLGDTWWLPGKTDRVLKAER